MQGNDKSIIVNLCFLFHFIDFVGLFLYFLNGY